jgi:hypothetical protein
VSLTYWQRKARVQALARTAAYFQKIRQAKGRAEAAPNELSEVRAVLSHTRREPLRCACVRPDGRDRQTPAPAHTDPTCPHSTLWATTRRFAGRSRG